MLCQSVVYSIENPAIRDKASAGELFDELLIHSPLVHRFEPRDILKEDCLRVSFVDTSKKLMKKTVSWVSEVFFADRTKALARRTAADELNIAGETQVFNLSRKVDLCNIVNAHFGVGVIGLVSRGKVCFELVGENNPDSRLA